MIKWDSFLGCRAGSTFANQSMWYITLIKEKIRTIRSCQSMQKKTFDKIQHPFLIKTFEEVRMEGIYLNIIKAIYEKPTANIILNGEKLRAFPLRWGTQQGCPLSPLLFKKFFFQRLFIFGTERDRAWTGEGQRERETQNWKQAPGSEPQPRARCGAQTHRPRDRDLAEVGRLTDCATQAPQKSCF